MRTIPSAMSTGFTNSLPAIYLVKIQGSGGSLFYWPNRKKNRAGNVVVLKETSGGAALTYDAGMIADEIDGTDEEGIGSIQSGIDIYTGGGIGSIGDTTITILNQLRFDQAVVAAGVNIENRPIEIFFGFIPDGATPTIIITTDLLKLWSGFIQNTEYTHGEYVLSCSDGGSRRHKDLPTRVIKDTEFPKAPKDSIGKYIPIAYGAWYSDLETEADFEELSLAPTIKTDEESNEFYIADHEGHTFGGIYYFDSENGIYGLISPVPTVDNDNTFSFLYYNHTDYQIRAAFRKIMVPYYTTGDDNPDILKPFDKDVTTFAVVKDVTTYNTKGAVDVRAPGDMSLSNGMISGTGEGYKARIYVGAITSAETDKVRLEVLRRDGYIFEEALGFINNADANTIRVMIKSLTDTPTMEWGWIFDRIFTIATNAATSMQVQIKHVVIEFYARVCFNELKMSAYFNWQKTGTGAKGGNVIIKIKPGRM